MTSKPLFAPSMMCVPPYDTQKAVEIFEKKGIAGLHIDVMDGVFVPNIQLGTDYCKYMREISDLPLDFHLMIERPEDKIDWFPIKEGDYVSVHAESTAHLQRAFDRIKAKGAKPIAAINPATPISAVEEVFGAAAGILIMTVSPGYAGQKLIPSTIEKIAKLRRLLDGCGMSDKLIEVDGNVNPENYIKMRKAGADMFVIGSSGFLNTRDFDKIAEGIDKFYGLCE